MLSLKELHVFLGKRDNKDVLEDVWLLFQVKLFY